MSSYNFTRPTKPNYFVNLLVKGYIFPAVLIATVLATILSVGFQIDLFSQLENNSKIFDLDNTLVPHGKASTEEINSVIENIKLYAMLYKYNMLKDFIKMIE